MTSTAYKPTPVYVRKYKKLKTNEVEYQVQSEKYEDPILWTDIEGGYWIDNEPNLFK